MERRERRNDRDDRGSRGRDRDDDREERRPGRRGRDDEDDRGGRGGRSSGYTYRQRDPSSAKKRSEQSAGDFDKFLKDHIKMFKPNDKDNVVRFLPPTWDDADHFGVDVWMHYGVGPDRQSFLCLHKMKGEPCPICDERKKAQRAGDDEYAKELEPKRRVLVYLVDRDNEKEGVQAWAMPWTVDRDVNKISVDKRTGEVLPIDHPEDGYDVEFTKEGAKDRTKYTGIAISRRASDLGNPKWLDFAIENPLPDQLVYFDFDHISKVFDGGSSSRDRDDRDDDRGRDRGGRSRDDDDDRGDSRSRDSGRSRRKAEPELDWATIHEMTGKELDALVEEKDLSLDPTDFKDDEELADAICEELDISKPRAGRDRDDRDDDDRGDAGSRLRRMRRERGD